MRYFFEGKEIQEKILRMCYKNSFDRYKEKTYDEYIKSLIKNNVLEVK